MAHCRGNNASSLNVDTSQSFSLEMQEPIMLPSKPHVFSTSLPSSACDQTSGFCLMNTYVHPAAGNYSFIQSRILVLADNQLWVFGYQLGNYAIFRYDDREKNWYDGPSIPTRAAFSRITDAWVSTYTPDVDVWLANEDGQVLQCSSTRCEIRGEFPGKFSNNISLQGVAPQTLWILNTETNDIYEYDYAEASFKKREIASLLAVSSNINNYRVIGIQGKDSKDVDIAVSPQDNSLGSIVILHWNGSSFTLQKVLNDDSLYEYLGWYTSPITFLGGNSEDQWFIGYTSPAPSEKPSLKLYHRTKIGISEVTDPLFAKSDIVFSAQMAAGKIWLVVRTEDPNIELRIWDGTTWQIRSNEVFYPYNTWSYFSVSPLGELYTIHVADPKKEDNGNAFENITIGKSQPNAELPQDIVWAHPEQSPTIRTLWSPGKEEAWAYAESQLESQSEAKLLLWHIQGSSITEYIMPERIVSIWGASANDVWFVSNDGLYHFDGTFFQKHKIPSDSSRIFSFGTHSIWGSSGSDIWAVASSSAQGYIFRYNGKNWLLMARVNTEIHSVFGTDSNHVWFGGKDCLFIWDGQSFKTVPDDGGHLQDYFVDSIYGNSASELWLITKPEWWVHYTTKKEFLSFNGSNFAFVPDSSSIVSVSGAKPDQVWMTTDRELFQRKGNDWVSWLKVAPPYGYRSWQVTGTDENNVWLYGGPYIFQRKK